MADDIADWRARIDEIDDQIALLLNERASYAIEIGRIKRTKGLAIHNPEREHLILERIIRNGDGPLTPDSLRRLFGHIIEETRNRESEEL